MAAAAAVPVSVAAVVLAATKSTEVATATAMAVLEGRVAAAAAAAMATEVAMAAAAGSASRAREATVSEAAVARHGLLSGALGDLRHLFLMGSCCPEPAARSSQRRTQKAARNTCSHKEGLLSFTAGGWG